jgi:hypothetical protein
MKYLTILAIIAIHFNLQWLGEPAPNYAEVRDEIGVIEITEQIDYFDQGFKWQLLNGREQVSFLIVKWIW